PIERPLSTGVIFPVAPVAGSLSLASPSSYEPTQTSHHGAGCRGASLGPLEGGPYPRHRSHRGGPRHFRPVLVAQGVHPFRGHRESRLRGRYGGRDFPEPEAGRGAW